MVSVTLNAGWGRAGCKNEPKQLTMTVEKGAPDGHEVRFKGASEQTPGQVPGDVIVLMRQKQHELFTRKGNDLHMTMEISLKVPRTQPSFQSQRAGRSAAVGSVEAKAGERGSRKVMEAG